MRLEQVNQRTWLLGAIAAWALLVWLLALAGMGGRVRVSGDDPSLVQPLPVLPALAENAGRDPGRFAETAARPLFSEDRRPRPFFLSGDEKPAGTFDYVLTSVLIAPPLEMAILQSGESGQTVRLKVGQSLPSAPEWRLSSVAARSAVLEGPEGQRTLPLRVYGADAGHGEVVLAVDAPPPMAAQPAPVASGDLSGLPPGSGSGSRLADAATLAAAAEVTPESRAAEREALRQRIEARRARLNERPAPASPATTERPD